MATVSGKTSLKIDDLVNGSVISGEVNDLGNLILKTRGNAEINAGSVLSTPTSVKKFGAKGDGVTDDTAAIQACLTAGSAYFPAGVYLVSDDIFVPQQRTITGDGMYSSIIKVADASTDLAVAVFTTATVGQNWNIFISNIGIDGNRANNTGSYHGIYMDRPCFLEITSVNIHDVEGGAIYLDNPAPGVSLGAPSKITDCYILDCGGWGIFIDDGVTDVQIANCDVGQCDSHCIYLGGISASVVGTMAWGAKLSGIYSGGAGNHWITGCRMDFNWYYGLWVDAPNVQVSNSLIYCNSAREGDPYTETYPYDETYPGVLVTENGADFTMTGCRVFGGVNGGPNHAYGVQLDTARSGPSLIVGNNLSDNAFGALIALGSHANDKIDRNIGLSDVGADPLAAYPVGAVYISVASTSPATLFGGTWVAFGTGRALVGIDTGQTEFNTIEKTGGAKTHTLSTSEMPSHSHIMVDSPATGYTNTPGSGTPNPVNALVAGAAGGRFSSKPNYNLNDTAGGGGAHNNLQPYITVYMWKRTA